MVDYADIGKRIRACRLAKGMTQEQLANEVGVVVTHISHIETGNSVPSLKTLIDIINALDCSADESTALSGYYNHGRLHIQYKYHFTKRRGLVLWWTTLTSENASVPAALQRA